jgi:hypothetical protein
VGTLHFTILGQNGKPCQGRGTLLETRAHGTHIVRLSTNDLGGFGTYRRGMEIRVLSSEVNPTQKS